MKLYNLIRDVAADTFGGWELETNIQAGGRLAAPKLVTYRTCEVQRAKERAKTAAGIADEMLSQIRHCKESAAADDAAISRRRKTWGCSYFQIGVVPSTRLWDSF